MRFRNFQPGWPGILVYFFISYLHGFANEFCEQDHAFCMDKNDMSGLVPEGYYSPGQYLNPEYFIFYARIPYDIISSDFNHVDINIFLLFIFPLLPLAFFVFSRFGVLQLVGAFVFALPVLFMFSHDCDRKGCDGGFAALILQIFFIGPFFVILLMVELLFRNRTKRTPAHPGTQDEV